MRDQSTLRIQVRDDLRNGKANCCLKHLTSALLRNPKHFYLAAAALIVEAKYLSKLNHPNIIKLKGLAMAGEPSRNSPAASFRSSNTRKGEGNQDGFESGQYDSYFLISERLTDTLDRRIRQWKKEQPTHKKLAEQSSQRKIQTWKLMMRKTSYALQISNALQYLHARNLLYRDLKPQNIGFVGDNQTIAIFNFGLVRELNPATGKVTEDEVTAMYSAASWRYTAVECFPQEALLALSKKLKHSTQLLSHTTRSAGLELSSSGSGSGMLAAKDSRHKKRHTLSLDQMEQIRKQCGEENSQSTAQSAPIPSKDSLGSNGVWNDINMKPCYDMKVDVYSWAMVYYEMLTLNQPFAKMSQRDHLRHVCGKTLGGYEGGQRPGIYQYDLLPSMISLLQRAWDQNPSKRPTMESVGRSLQTILRELEEKMKEEQREMALAITPALPHSLMPLPDTSAPSRMEASQSGGSDDSDIDVAALEYETWDELDEGDSSEEVDGSSFSGNEADKDIGKSEERLAGSAPVSPTCLSVDYDSENESDMCTSQWNRSLSRRSSNQNGMVNRTFTNDQYGTKKRMRKKAKQSRRVGSEMAQHRTTSRMSRRTIRLSRQSLWLLQQDRKTLLFIAVIASMVFAAFGFWCYHVYQRKQHALLGVPLDELRGLDKMKIMEKLRGTIETKCQRELPVQESDLPMLFKGGALTPYDEDCVERLQKELEEEMVRKLNLTATFDASAQHTKHNSTGRQCGFLKIHNFDPPPPGMKKGRSKWQRKRPWKFFRND